MEELLKQFNSEIDKAYQSAFQSAKGGDEKWNTMLNSYGAKPLSTEEKGYLSESSMKIATGAYPIELRRVYDCIVTKYRANASSSQELNQALNNFDMDNRIKEYYQKIKPFSGLGDIFKNAQTGTAKYSSGLQKEKQLTYKCKNCGAPRLEEMQYDSCLFCGSTLFEKA